MSKVKDIALDVLQIVMVLSGLVMLMCECGQLEIQVRTLLIGGGLFGLGILPSIWRMTDNDFEKENFGEVDD